MDFFDSPIPWAIIIWWVLSMLFGSKKRRQKIQQAAQKTKQENAESVQDDDPMGIGDQWRTIRDFSRPDPGKSEEPNLTSIEPQSRVKEASPWRTAATRATPIVQDLMRELGMPDEIMPRQQVSLPQQEPSVEIEPEPEILDPEEAGAIMEAPTLFDEEPQMEVVELDDYYGKPQGGVLDRLQDYPRWQQAIVYQTILGPPKVFQRGVR